MIKYENYLGLCWLLNSSESSQDFIRSEFDYGIRQRRALRGYPKAGFRLIVEHYDMSKFRQFWHDLNYGTDKFLTDQPIFGSFDTNKVVRFISAYRLKELSYKRWEITCAVEIVEHVNDVVVTKCPLVPSKTLFIGTPLVPCKI